MGEYNEKEIINTFSFDHCDQYFNHQYFFTDGEQKQLSEGNGIKACGIL